MNCYQMIFSPTGGAEKVAASVTRNWPNVQTIDLSDKSKCISCMRCVSICPVHARSVNKVMVSVAALAIKKACSTPKANELYL